MVAHLGSAPKATTASAHRASASIAVKIFYALVSPCCGKVCARFLWVLRICAGNEKDPSFPEVAGCTLFPTNRARTYFSSFATRFGHLREGK
jgi:hypothetical protein